MKNKILLILIALLLFAVPGYTTISSEDLETSAACDGATSAFVYNFRILQDADMSVIVRDSLGTETPLVLTTDYTVANATYPSIGGTVTLVDPATDCATNETLHLLRDQSYLQGTEIGTGIYPNTTHEETIDELTMSDQQIREQTGRALKVNSSSSLTEADLTLSPSADTAVCWNASGTAITNCAISVLTAADIKILSQDYSGDIETAIATIGASETYVYVDVADTVSGAVTAPANITWHYWNGAVTTVASGGIFTPNGNVVCGNFQCFEADNNVTGTIDFSSSLMSILNPTWWGSTGINLAVASASSQTVRVSDIQTLSASLTIPINVSLKIENGGSINKTSTYTLTVNGSFEAGEYQTFINFAVGDVSGLYNVNPAWWGAGAGAANDAIAINSAAKAVTSRSGDPLGTFNFTEGKSYSITASIDFTRIRKNGLIINGHKAIILCNTNGSACLDILGSDRVTVRNLNIHGSPTETPTTGIQHGRGISGEGSSNIKLENVQLTGNYTLASIYNGSSEVSMYDKVTAWNSEQNGLAYYADGRNEAHIGSTIFGVTTPQDTAGSFNDQVYINSSFEQIANSPSGPAIRISTGSANSHKYIGCYAQAAGSEAVTVAYSIDGLELDIHIEAATVTNNVMFTPVGGTMTLRNFKLNEYFAFATDSIINADANTHQIVLVNSEINVGNTFAAVPIFGAVTDNLDFHGELKVGANSASYNLSNMQSITGTIYSELALSNFTYPLVSRVSVISKEDGRIFSKYTVTNETPTIASPAGAELSLSEGNIFFISGTNNITSIASASTWLGRSIKLMFGGILTFTDGSNLKLAGNFVTTADDTITITSYDGTNWYEDTRSVN